jgi:2-alkyl-3-oxoalkanoate reductase
VKAEPVRIWSYLSDYMRGTSQPGWRLPVPYWLAFYVVRLAFATIFRRATRCPVFSSRLDSSRGSSRSASRTAGCRKTPGWTPPLDY